MTGDLFSLYDEKGTCIIANKYELLVINDESRVLQSLKFQNAINFLYTTPLLIIGFNGAITILESDNIQTKFLFPVGHELSSTNCIDVSSSLNLIAVGVQNLIFVYDRTKHIDSALIAVLDAHEYRITHVAFLKNSGMEHFLITVSEENRFIVWNLSKRSIVYESPFESSIPISGINAFIYNFVFSISFSDGYVRLYDTQPLTSEKPCVKQLKTINVSARITIINEEEEEDTIIISRKKTPKPLLPNDEPTNESYPIISTGYYSLRGSEYLLCSTQFSIISVCINNLSIMTVSNFDSPIQSISFMSSIVALIFENSKDIIIKRLGIGIVPEIGVSLFTTEDPPSSSPLYISLPPKTKQATPIVTLHKIIKSSGYTSKPPAIKQPKKDKSKKTKKDEPEILVTNFNTPQTLVTSFSAFNTPIINASLSPNGKRLIASDNSGTVLFLKSKSGSFPAYIGHSLPVTSLSWSNGSTFLSSSIDKTIKIWDIDRSDPLLVIQKTKSEDKGTPFPDEISSASFFWKDKFILIGSGKTLYMYAYGLPNLASKNIQDMHQTGNYKNIFTKNIESGKITCMSSSNFPQSHIVSLATASRSISIFDFYAGECVMEIPSLHERSIFSLCSNYGGIFTPRNNAPDLLLSGSTDETFRLWDLRNSRCERTIMSGSRVKRVGSCFSPDSKFIAIGTERSGIEIWDISMGTCVQKIKEDFRGTAVTWLQWNPGTGRLQSATEAGSVKVFE